MENKTGGGLPHVDIERIPGMVCIWRFENETAVLLRTNRAFRELFGPTEASPFFKGLSQREQKRIHTCFSPIITSEQAGEYSGRVVRADGKSCWVHLAATRQEGRDGQGEYLAVVTDITEYMLREKQLDDEAEELEETKKELRCVYDTYQDGIARVRADELGTLTVLNANRLFYHLIGWDAERLENRWEQKLNRLDAEAGDLAENVRTGKRNFRWRCCKADGTEHWIQADLSPLERDGDGLALLTLRELGEEAEHGLNPCIPFQTMLDRSISGGILVRRADETLAPVYISKSIPLILGYPEEEFSALIRSGYWNLLHPADAERMLARREDMQLPVAAYTTEYRARKKDGSYIWVYDNTRLDRDVDGQPIYFSILVDASKRKDAEEELRIMEEEYRLAAAHSGNLTYRVQLATRHADLTEEAARTLGLQTEIEDVPESVIASGSIAPESVEAYRTYYRAMLSGRPSGRTQVLRRVKGGEYRWFLGQFTTIFTLDGKAVSAVGTFEDISEQREREALLNSLRKERELLSAVAEHSGRMAFKYDLPSHTAYLGKAVADRFGLKETIPELSERTLRLDQVAKESREAYLDFFRAMERGEPSGAALIRRKDVSGAYSWYQISFTTLFEQQAPRCAMISFQDVSDRHELELTNLEYQQQFDAMEIKTYTCYAFDLTRNRCDQEKGALLEHVRECSDGTLEGMVQAAAEFYIAREAEAEFRRFNNRVRLLQDYERGTGEEQVELRIRVQDTERWVLERVQMFEDPYSKDVRCVFSFTDIDQEKRNILSLEKRADFDAMTGLLNRTAFSERVGQILAREERNHALLLIDLDQFKEFNDSFGHAQGDQLLSAMSKFLSAMLRPMDLLGRLGGDEFLIFLINIPDAGLAMRRADLLCRTIREKLSRQGVSMTASVGVALSPGDGHSFQDLYEQADKGLYAVKKKGGNGCFREIQDDQMQAAAVKKSMASRVFIRTFGHFDVFVDSEPLSFSSAKAKELLAVLVDRRGGILSSDEAICCLWEDEPSNKVTQARYRKVALRLKNALDEAGIGDILVSRRDGRCVDANCFACDYYQYLEGDEAARAMYHGSYMSNYSWAESTLAYIEFDSEPQ